MEDSKIHKTIHDRHHNNGFFPDCGGVLGLNCKREVSSGGFFINLMKNSLLNGADMLLMARKSPKSSANVSGLGPQQLMLEKGEDEYLNSESLEVCEECNSDNGGKNERASGKSKYPLLQTSSIQHKDKIFNDNDEYVDVSKVVNCPAGGYDEFPLNFLAFLAILVLKSVGFQLSILLKFVTLPIWLSYFSLMFLVFPFQILKRLREQLTKKLLRMWGDLYFSIASFICDRFNPQKSVNLAMRFGWALFWSVSVCLMLVGLLVSGFVIGGLALRRLVEEPIQTTEPLNFDYAKTSPVAFVPLMSSTGVDVSSGLFSKNNLEVAEHTGAHVIPYNHKLQLTVSLTLPESAYNRKLGIFQVRVEFLSANGKVTASSSHPCMLKFKSQPIHLVETAVKSVLVIAGLQSESQILNVRFSDFTEGYEPTECLRVVLEARAEYKAGAGVPEIYAASLALESKLPQFKRIIWCWKRTIFVWMGLASFLTELVFVLIFFRPLLVPRGRPKAAKDSHQNNNKISWYKSSKD